MRQQDIATKTTIKKIMSILKENQSTNNDHDHEYNVINERIGSCSIEGYKVYQCSCGNKITVNTGLFHDYVITSESNPTCITDGSITYKCSSCGKVIRNSIDKIDHLFVDDTCIMCGMLNLEAGVYDKDDNLLLSWDDMISAGLDLSANLSSKSQCSSVSSGLDYIIASSGISSTAYKLVIGTDFNSLGSYSCSSSYVKVIIMNNNITTISPNFMRTGGRVNDTPIEYVRLSDNLIKLPSNISYGNTVITHIIIPAGCDVNINFNDNGQNSKSPLYIYFRKNNGNQKLTAVYSNKLNAINIYFEGPNDPSTYPENWDSLVSTPPTGRTSAYKLFFNVSMKDFILTHNFWNNLYKIMNDGTFDGNLDIPEGVLYIPSLSTTYKSLPTKIHIPSSIKYIPYMGLISRNVTEIVIDDGPTTIEHEAFRLTSALNEIELPDSVTEILGTIFSGSSVSKIFIPKSVKYIRGAGTTNIDTVTDEIKAQIYDGTSSDMSHSVFYNSSASLIIFTEYDEKPEGWDDFWNMRKYTTTNGEKVATEYVTVQWGVTREQYISLYK